MCKNKSYSADLSKHMFLQNEIESYRLENYYKIINNLCDKNITPSEIEESLKIDDGSVSKILNYDV